MQNAAASRLVLEPYSEATVITAARECLQSLKRNPSLVIAFVTADYRPFLQDFLELVQLHAHATLIVGGSASGLIGSGVEAESGSGFSLQLLSLPSSRLCPITFNEDQSDDFTESDWKNAVGRAADSDAWLFLGNPLKVAAEPWLRAWSAAFPGIPTIGGLLSGGERGDDVFVFHNRSEVEAGIAIGIKGGVKVHAVVSQGCRPIGEPHAITGASENVVKSIGSLPAYERLNESFESLSSEDKARAAGNIFAGLAVNEYVDDFKTGDFLIRNLVDFDPTSGAVALAAYPRVGQTLQFQLRDRHSADEELKHLLTSKAKEGIKPFASLMFVCGGRGEGLFGKSSHDAQALRDQFGPIPNAGLFCNGEIGPVGGGNFVHGYTAVIGLFE
ncbi:MAG: Small ligand-binding sensory domain FIST [Verrucomicrobia bacterium]|nr:MAG: Small ligand-binding sensory domain FIST [Verrucomicrobiota bacterium]